MPGSGIDAARGGEAAQPFEWCASARLRHLMWFVVMMCASRLGGPKSRAKGLFCERAARRTRRSRTKRPERRAFRGSARGSTSTRGDAWEAVRLDGASSPWSTGSGAGDVRAGSAGLRSDRAASAAEMAADRRSS
jgi:hypothetical protein